MKIVNNYASDKTVTVSLNVTNSGEIDGKEVVQLYIRDMYAGVTRPVKELKGFELLELKAGETKTVSFTLTDAELGFYSNDGKWLTEPGAFKVFAGGSSETVMEGDFEL